MSGRTCVVIVNYNSGIALTACLEALQQQTVRHDVVVIDNASVDDSARSAYDKFPMTRIIPLRHNTGFARGFNVGVERVPPTCSTVVALNPDTLPEPVFLERLVAPLDDPTIASVAGTLTFSSAPNRIASAGINVHRNGVAIDSRVGLPTELLPEPHPVFGASGGAAAYRLSAFRDVGGFCEPFFMYLEDVDLAWRLRLHGWKAVWESGARATHDYSSSAGEGSPFKRRLLARNRIWTLARCLPQPIWKRDRRSILTFDLLAVAHGVARRDSAALSGRAQAVATLPLRLPEGTGIQRSASSEWDAIEPLIQPAINPRELLLLRRLTERLATFPPR